MLIELVDVGPHEAHSASTSSLQEVVETKTKLKVDYDQWQTCNELKGIITAKQKVIIFADDVIIYFKNPNSAFPEIFWKIWYRCQVLCLNYTPNTRFAKFMK